MIKKFEQYNKIDPYNEEIWNDLYDYENIMNYLSTLNSKDIVYTEDKTRSFLFTPNVLAVRFYTKLEYGQKEYCLYLPPFYRPLDLTSEETHKIYKYMENKYFKELNENMRDFDPYDEEDWNDLNLKKGDIVRILPKFEWYLNNTRDRWDKELHMKFIGKIAEIKEPFYPYRGINCCLISNKIHKLRNLEEPWEDDWHGGYMIPIDCVEKLEKNNESIEIDPYGEEDWEDKNINTGSIVKVKEDVLKDRIYGPKLAGKMALSNRSLSLIGKKHVVWNIIHTTETLIFIDDFCVPIECVEKIE